MAQTDAGTGGGGEEGLRFVPELAALHEDLACELRAWADSLGTEAEHSDPVLEERGSNDWGGQLRKGTHDWLKATRSLLTAHGRADVANDLRDRFDSMYQLADAYQQALESLEDEARVHVQALVSRFREKFGPDREAELWGHCKGIQRVWTFWLDGNPLETVEQFAEAVDECHRREDGSKRRRLAEVKREAVDLAEHIELLAKVGAGGTEPRQSDTDEMKEGDSPAPGGEAADETEFGAPQVDPYDKRVVNWVGKRLYLGHDTQVSRLFWLLAKPIGVARNLGEVQRAVDQMETDRDERGEAEFQLAMNRLAKAISKLRKQLREHDLDDHVLIVKGGERDWPNYTMVARFGES